MEFWESAAEFAIFTLAFGVGILVLVAFSHWKRRRSREGSVIRQLRTTQATPIADVMDGSQAKIVGKVRYADEPHCAPLSGRSCAYFTPKTSLGVHKQLGYYEAILQESDMVAVYGQAKWEPDPDPESAGDDYRDRPKRLRMTATPDGSLLISDDPKATLVRRGQGA